MAKRAKKRTGDGVDDEFEALAQQVSRDAAKIDCSAMEYRRGLQTIIERLKVDQRANAETNGMIDE
jgi:hypothetical protein